MALAGQETAVDLGNGLSASIRLQDAGGYIDLNRSDPKLIEAAARFGGLGKAAEGLAQKIEKLRKEAMPPGSEPAAPAGKAFIAM